MTVFFILAREERGVHTLSCGMQNSKVVPKIPSPYIPSTLFNILLLRVSRIREYDGTMAHVIPLPCVAKVMR